MDLENRPINLLLAVHAHQPVDNFDNIFCQAFEKSYLPFFRTLSNFPEIKLSFHASGSLLDWALEREAGFIDLIKILVERGQLELLTGGYYEPILVLISDRDRRGQIESYSSKIKEIFGFKPRGLWLTERVWESSLVESISSSGIDFTIVDDEHFKRAGLDPERLKGYYITEDNNSSLAIFPSSKFLRYSLPFKLPQESIDYLSLKREQGLDVISFGDDLEKFGFWPGTYDWVYKEKWLHNFFALLSENKGWIRTEHFGDILNNRNSSGRVYLPSSSYSEMMEWSGGLFKNFLVKYPESNHIQKRMFSLSLKLEALEDNLKKRYSDIRKKLYKAQNNDVYWHGVFGGLYLTHLRYLAYKYLIDAELKLNAVAKTKFPVVEQADIDLDGDIEIIFKDKVFDLYLSPEQGGTITEIDYKPGSMNILNTLTRREEGYHKKIMEKSGLNNSSSNTNNPSSIHDRDVAVTQEIIDSLIYDSYRKSAWIDHLYSESNFSEESLLKNKALDKFKLYDMPYAVKVNKKVIEADISAGGLSLKKRLKIDRDILRFSYSIKNSAGRGLLFSSEFNLLLYSEDILEKKKFFDTQELVIEDSWFKLKYLLDFSEKTRVFVYPIYTVSDSEAGLERSYQGLSMHFIWELKDRSNELGFNIRLDRL
jgi:4-alpha-glucanotransferase